MSTRDVGEPERRRQRAQPVGIEPDVHQRAERHVAGDAAERIENRDAHQNRYDAPLPVLNTKHFASRGMRPAATSCSVTASAQPPSGAASTPLARDSSQRAVANGVLAHRVRVALALAQRAKNEAIAERSRHAQSARVRRRILPRRRLRLAGRERAHDRRASVGLRDDHVRERDVLRQPAAVAHLGEHLPHADQTRAAAGRIDDVRRQSPAELLGELDAHRLLSFDAIRLAQRRDVEVAALRGERARLLAGVADVSVDELQIGAERANRVENRLRRRLGRVDAHGNSRGGPYAVSAAPALPAVGTTKPGTPSPRARVTAALIPRALNDAVGLSPSSFTHSRATPISRASAGSSCSGVSPSPSDTGVFAVA